MRRIGGLVCLTIGALLWYWALDRTANPYISTGQLLTGVFVGAVWMYAGFSLFFERR